MRRGTLVCKPLHKDLVDEMVQHAGEETHCWQYWTLLAVYVRAKAPMISLCLALRTPEKASSDDSIPRTRTRSEGPPTLSDYTHTAYGFDPTAGLLLLELRKLAHQRSRKHAS